MGTSRRLRERGPRCCPSRRDLCARLVVLEDSGHLPTLEQPDQATQAVRAWLRSVGS